MAPRTVLAQKHTDLIDVLVSIHNGPRCELKQLNQLNQPRPDLIDLIDLIVLVHNGPGDRVGTKQHIDFIDLFV